VWENRPDCHQDPISSVGRDALGSVIESRSGKFFFFLLYIYISFYYLGVQISEYFFPEVLKIQPVFEHVAK
jgi:hypothetical protein